MLPQPIPFEQLLYLLQHFLPYQLGSTLSTFVVSLMGTKGVWAWTVIIIDALEFFYIQVVLISLGLWNCRHSETLVGAGDLQPL
jgi:hypothetical protein